jgi:serine/threonine protein phosphatase PrpC
MKITKRQLRRIIKEEKRKILNENRTRGSYSDVRYEDKVKKALTDMYEIMEQNIVDDGFMREEAEDMAAGVVMELVREFMSSMGHLGDTSYTHGDKKL